MYKIALVVLMTVSFNSYAQQLQRCIDPITGLGYAAVNCNAQAVSGGGSGNCCVKTTPNPGQCIYKAPIQGNNCPSGFQSVTYAACPAQGATGQGPCNP